MSKEIHDDTLLFDRRQNLLTSRIITADAGNSDKWVEQVVLISISKIYW